MVIHYDISLIWRMPYLGCWNFLINSCKYTMYIHKNSHSIFRQDLFNILCMQRVWLLNASQDDHLRWDDRNQRSYRLGARAQDAEIKCTQALEAIRIHINQCQQYRALKITIHNTVPKVNQKLGWTLEQSCNIQDWVCVVIKFLQTFKDKI